MREELHSHRISYMLGYNNGVEISYINVSSFSVYFQPRGNAGSCEWRGHGSLISEEITEYITPSTTTVTTLAASARRWSLAIVSAPRIGRLAPRV